MAQHPLDGSPGSFITVFGDCIRDGSDNLFVDEAVVLSYTIAHEIGHLLLPQGHSFTGIMQGRPNALEWQRAARGALRFSPMQAALLREAARARQRIAAASNPDQD